MTAATSCLMEQFPVRKSSRQKAAFREWVAAILTEAGYEPRVESGRYLVQNHNVVVGDPEKAAVVFTAHYDTPARLLLPNTNFPYNMLFTLLAQAPLLILMFCLAVAADVAVLFLTDSALFALLATYAVLLALLLLMLVGPANPSNVNDNTSGVAAVLEIALSLPSEQREKVAFVLFDNEEKGLLGSAVLYRKHGKAMKNMMVVNFDCVSDGDHIHLIPNRKMRGKTDRLEQLEQCFQPTGNKHVVVARGGHYPSDHKYFPLGVGVAALHKGFLGYRLGRIHTYRDTVFQAENIELLSRGALKLVQTVSGEREEAAHEV